MNRSLDGSANSNTGLSLRKVSAVRKMLASYERQNNSEAEDVWLFERISGKKTMLHTHDGRQVMEQEAMGYHIKDGMPAMDLWGSEQRSRVFEYCPEVGIILGHVSKNLCSESGKDLSSGKAVSHVGGNIATNKAVVGPPQPPPFPWLYEASP